MKITDKAFNSLRRFHLNTGVTVNIGARLAFFKSIESGYIYDGKEIEPRQRQLSKHVWLGGLEQIVEILLKERYREYDDKALYRAWNAHVEDGAASIEGKTNLSSFAQ
ncbi:DNA sulfur modification protein DndE [Reinekea marina]|nr:DNA sulfur modification protein DndE [Reinekea marina]MDN3647571.1 DNA sulfur modification protein DndE [Reinekea marina]